MTENLLFTKQKEQKDSQKKVISASFFFVFLSLILSVLCFFIFLVHASSFERIKVNAVRTSLHSSFGQNLPLFQMAQPSFEAGQVGLYHQSLIQKIFPASEIVQDLSSDSVSLFFNSNQIFEPDSDVFRPAAAVFFKQLKSLLNASFVRSKYHTDIILFEDLKSSENYPVFEHMQTLRLEKIRDKMQRIGIDEDAFSVGFERGDVSRFIVHFHLKERQ